MKSMPPFQIITIAIFGVLALAGLFAFATFKGFKGGAKPVGDVYVWGTVPAYGLEGVIQTLRQNHQEFTKIVYVEHDPSTFDTDLVEALASGAGPDLIITDQERIVTERDKLSIIPFKSLPERTYRDNYLPINEIYLTSTGTYGVPFLVDPLVLYYNRTTLASANIPQVPTTWEAIVGLTPHLTTKTDAGVISKSAIPLGTYENIPHARAIISLLLLQSGSRMTESNSTGFRTVLGGGGNDRSAVAPGDAALSFYTQFADPAKTVYTWNRSKEDGRQSFLAGDSAFYIGFASERRFLSTSNPNLDFDIAPIPQPETSTSKTDYALAYAFAIPRATKNYEGAYRVAQALSGKESMVPAAHALGMAPALRSELSASADDIFSPVSYPAALSARGWLSPAPVITDRVFASMINSVISGRSSVHDALVTADASLTAALK